MTVLFNEKSSKFKQLPTDLPYLRVFTETGNWKINIVKDNSMRCERLAKSNGI